MIPRPIYSFLKKLKIINQSINQSIIIIIIIIMIIIIIIILISIIMIIMIIKVMMIELIIFASMYIYKK